MTGGEVINAHFDYAPYKWQREFHHGCKNKRKAIAIVPRQHGKTELVLYELTKRALEGPRGACYAYLSPTLNGAKRVFWSRLKRFLSPLNRRLKIRESELTIELEGHFKIYLLGSDNEVGIRGLTIRGYVIDEYDHIPRDVMASAVLPTLTKWGDDIFMIYIGTLSKGQSNLWELFEKHKDDPEWYCKKLGAKEIGMMTEAQMEEKKQMMGLSAYLREYESDPYAAPEASVFGDYVYRAEQEGRILEFPILPTKQIVFAVDLGIADSMAVWAAQLGREYIHLIGYHEYNGTGLVAVTAHLQEVYRGYSIGEVYFPHDGEHRDKMYAQSTIDAFRDLGFGDPVGIGRPRIFDSLNATRLNFSRCKFHKTKCELGIHRLKMLEFDTDIRTGMVLDKFKRDQSIHCADAFRYLLNQIERDFPIGEGGPMGFSQSRGRVIRSV